MSTRYPNMRDRLSTGYATDADRDAAINALEDRVGILFDVDPASFEDRLYTVENLVVDVLAHLERLPKGLLDARK